MNKVLITKYIDAKEVKLEQEYIPKKPTKGKTDCIKRLDKEIHPLSSKHKARKEKRKRNKLRKQARKNKDGNKFYRSREWLQLRYRVLQKYQAKCMCCGRTPQEHGIIVQVDHVKPRSKYPELELDFNNLQVLCQACNAGKSNLDKTDWRLLCNNDIYLIKKAQKMS